MVFNYCFLRKNDENTPILVMRAIGFDEKLGILWYFGEKKHLSNYCF